MNIQQQYTVFRKALETILEKEGKVCDNYMECDHVACNSSYSAWAIADAALPKCAQCGGRDFLGVEDNNKCADCLWEDHLESLAGIR